MTATLTLPADETEAVRHVSAMGVELAGDPGSEALRVGGHDLPFTAATVHLARGSVPVLTVDLPVIGGIVVTLEAHPEVSERTRRALMAMGWTPPAEAACGE